MALCVWWERVYACLYLCMFGGNAHYCIFMWDEVSGHFPLRFPETALIEKQTQPVLILSVLSWPLVSTPLLVHASEISCATDVIAKVCSEATVFRLMSLACSPWWKSKVRQKGRGIQSDYFYGYSLVWTNVFLLS